MTKFDEDLLSKVENFCKFTSAKEQNTVKKTDEDRENQLSLKKIPSEINKGMIESELLPSESEH